MRSSNNCSGSVSSFDFEFLCCAHIYQLQVSIGAHHEVLRLEVSIDDFIGMEMLQDTEDLADQKFSFILVEGDHLCNCIEKIFTLNIFHHKVDEVSVLDQFVEADQEWMLGGSSQNLFFIHHVLNDLRLFHITPVENFNSVDLICPVIVASINLSEIPRSQFLDDMEISDDHFLLMVMSDCGLLDGLAHVSLTLCRFDLKIDLHLTHEPIAHGKNVLRNGELFVSHQLTELHNRILLVGDAFTFELGS